MKEPQRTESSKCFPRSYVAPTDGWVQGGGSPAAERSERLREAGEDREERGPNSPVPPLLSSSHFIIRTTFFTLGSVYSTKTARAEQTTETNNQIFNIILFRIQTGRRQTRRLCASVDKNFRVGDYRTV